MSLSKILCSAEKNGWHIKKYEVLQRDIPDFLAPWNNEINRSFFDFLSIIETMENDSQTIWCLCLSDFWDKNNSEFKWDEFRTMSLSSALSKEQENEIKAFWNEYLPICISVKNGYSYCAIDCKGNLVIGYEPEFELPTKLDLSYEQFLYDLVNGKALF